MFTMPGAPADSSTFVKGDASLIEQVIVRSARRPNADQEVRALVAATFETITESGSLDPQVRAILERSQLSRQVFYSHFASKDELLVVVLDAGWRTVATYTERLVGRATSHDDRLRAWITGIMRPTQDAASRRMTRPFANTGYRLEAAFPEQLGAARRSFVGALTGLIEAGVAAGNYESSAPSDDALVIYDAVFARQNRYLALDVAATDQNIDALHDFALRALARSG